MLTHTPVRLLDLRWRDATVSWLTDVPGVSGLGTGPMAHSAGQKYGLLAVVPMCKTDEIVDGEQLLAPRDETPMLPADVYAVVRWRVGEVPALAPTGAAARRWCEQAMAEFGDAWYAPSEARAEILECIARGMREGMLLGGSA